MNRINSNFSTFRLRRFNTPLILASSLVLEFFAVQSGGKSIEASKMNFIELPIDRRTVINVTQYRASRPHNSTGAQEF